MAYSAPPLPRGLSHLPPAHHRTSRRRRATGPQSRL